MDLMKQMKNGMSLEEASRWQEESAEEALTQKARVEAHILGLPVGVFSPKMLYESLQCYGIGAAAVRMKIRILEHEDVLVRVGFGRYVTMQHYRTVTQDATHVDGLTPRGAHQAVSV